MDLFPTAPTGAPTNIRVEPIGSQSLQVTWDPPKPIRMQGGEIKGYYIGWKKYNSTSPYVYTTRSTEDR